MLVLMRDKMLIRFGSETKLPLILQQSNSDKIFSSRFSSFLNLSECKWRVYRNGTQETKDSIYSTPNPRIGERISLQPVLDS